MKKAIFLFLVVFASLTSANAQLLKFGVKAGPNFSNFSGGAEDFRYSSRTNFHAGAFIELKLISILGLQPEVLYSSQGADVEGIGDFNLDYVSVPVMAKLYLLGEKLSIDAGPQFSFLIDDAKEVAAEVANGGSENDKFDFAVGGGATVYFTKSLSASARYMAGLTKVSPNADVKNTVLQVSVGYTF